MFLKMTSLGQDDQTVKDLQKASGSWGEIPPNLSKMTEEEFAQCDFWRFGHAAIMEFRQFPLKMVRKGKMTEEYSSVFLYHMPLGHGYALYSEYWSGQVHYFRFGCEHDWKGTLTEEEKSKRLHGLTYSKCSKCGIIDSFDTSD